MDPILSSDDAALAKLLRAARELAGLSRNDLARVLGVSWETVRQAEEGRDVRRSTLAQILRALPFLSPRALVLGDASAPPLASPAVWEFYRRHHGFVAAAMRHSVSVGADGALAHRVEVSGIRWIARQADELARRTDLMRSVILASGPVLRHLEAKETDVANGRVIEADGARHEFTFSRDPRRGFDYACSFVREPSGAESALQCEEDALARDAAAVTAKVAYPIERLELSVRLASGCELPAIAFFVAPEMSVPRQGALRLARAAYPEGVPLTWDQPRRIATIVVTKPLPNMRYGLAWVPASRTARGFTALSPASARRGARLGADGAAPSPSARITAARERAGVSRRELARVMEASAATVIGAENGDDLRASTLARVLGALPSLEPEDLFITTRPRPLRVLSPSEVWLYYRNLVGLEAAEATRTLTLTSAGDGIEKIRTSALRSLRVGSGPAIVQDGIAPGVHGKTGAVLLAQRPGGSRENVRVRWTRVPGESPEFQLMIPGALVAAGVSFERRDRKELAYKLRPEHVDRSIGPAYECFVPVRRLVLTVEFPKGSWPASVGAFVRAAVNVTNPRWPDLRADLHAESLRWTVQEGRRIVRLEVEHPMLGFRYSVSWKVAASPTPPVPTSRARTRTRR